MKAHDSQRGISIVATLFLIVVLATIGTFAVSIGTAQQQNVNFALLEHRAWAAAHTGVEIGANRALTAATCPAATNVNLAQAALTGFALTINCARSVHVINGNTHSVYRITSTARRGNFGAPEFVSRRIVRTVDNAP